MLREERGALTPFFAVMVLGMIAAAGLAVDWGRYLMAREAMVTATEAAALAGSGEAVRMAEFTARWQRGYWRQVYRPRTCYDAQGRAYDCGQWEWVCRREVPDPTRHFRGRESELLDDTHSPTYWANQLDGGCLTFPAKEIVPGTMHRWAEFPPQAEAAAAEMWRRNLGGAARAGAAVRGPEITVHRDPADPAYPSVRVRAGADVPSLLARALGIGGFRLARCAQAEVRGYRDTADSCR